MRNWIFWDETVLATKSLAELREHLQSLRSGGEQGEVLRIARRFVERGNGTDTIRLFTREELAQALSEIERSSRSLQFVDPIRIRMYKRYLAQTGG